jgi:hypothetical protein
VKAVFLLIFAAMLFAAPLNDQAASSGDAWLKLIDNGKYAESWKEASSYFRSGVLEKTWVSMVQGVRAPLGARTSRKLQNLTFTKTLPGAPDGSYAVMVFQTSFQNKASAAEQITVMADADQWRVAGYIIH